MSKPFPWDDKELETRMREAVIAYWAGRDAAKEKQLAKGIEDKGTRSEVTGGKHFHSFHDLFVQLANLAGYGGSQILTGSQSTFPGYFRATKNWDVVVVREDGFVAAIESKSQVGSWGKNQNNRIEEAIGSVTDVHMAFKYELCGAGMPWLGYFLLLEKSEESEAEVQIGTTPFGHDSIFDGASRIRRYEILCERFMDAGLYHRAALIVSPRAITGEFHEPNERLTVAHFLKDYWARLTGT